MIDGVDKAAENKTWSKAGWWGMEEDRGGGGEKKNMTDDASLVAMIDSVERLAVSVAGQPVRWRRRFQPHGTDRRQQIPVIHND